MSRLKLYFLETRPQFLLLSVVLAFLGTVIAWYDGHFNLGHALLAGFGLVLTHISVNTLNDYFDYRSGIDLATQRTPFSGGSGMLPSKHLSQKEVLTLGLGSLLLAVPIGIYFIIVRGWLLLPLLVAAALFILLYSPLILKQHWPEWAAGAGLGALPVLGVYFAQTGQYTWNALIVSIVPAFLVHNLLLLNEFPDADADRQGHRKTLPITLGKAKTAVFYSAVTIGVYVWVAVWVLLRTLPPWTLLALLTVPFAVKAIGGARRNNDPSRLIPGMAANVMIVLLTQVFIGVGFIIAHVL